MGLVDTEFRGEEEGEIKMTFKEFTKWCNERACDGCWGILDAMVCIDILSAIRKEPF